MRIKSQKVIFGYENRKLGEFKKVKKVIFGYNKRKLGGYKAWNAPRMLPLSSMKSMVFHGDLMDCLEVSAVTQL